MDLEEMAVNELHGKDGQTQEADAIGEMQLLYRTQLDGTWEMVIDEPVIFRDQYADTLLRVWTDEDAERYEAEIHRTDTETAAQLQDALTYLENLGYEGNTREVRP